MRTAQFAIRDFTAVARRRWKFPVFSTLIVTAGCLVGAFLLPREYESSTTILVQADQALASVTGYDRAMTFDNQLRNFDEIIYSRALLLSLADSLGMVRKGMSDGEIERVLEKLRSQISTKRTGSDSFRITSASSDPVQAKRGAELLTDLFIKTKMAVQMQQNSLTVEFYESKLAEYKRDLETSAHSLVSSLSSGVRELPVEKQALYSQMDEIERSIRNTDGKINNWEQKINLLRSIPDKMANDPREFRREDGKGPLFELERSDLPYTGELRPLILRYDELTRRYKGDYPDIVRVEAQIIDLLRRMRTAAATEQEGLRDDLRGLERRRAVIIEDLRKSSVIKQESQDQESTYDVKRKLYDDMRVRLEQARLAKEVNARGASLFVIIDPAIVPTVPTKPNRVMIVGAGLVLGFFLGILAAFVAELTDTVVRGPADVQVYNKPIVAYLPDHTQSQKQRGEVGNTNR